MTSKYIELKKTLKDDEIILVTGNFDSFHIGHERLLEYARSFNGKLIVGIYPDNLKTTSNPFSKRKLSVEKSGLADIVIGLETNVLELIEILQPNVVVKGVEHYQLFDHVEATTINSYGGRLFFGPGIANFTNNTKNSSEFQGYTKFNASEFLLRHKSSCDLDNLVKSFSKLKVIVIGDAIIDEYVDCEALGMSQEDATIVVSPKQTNRFLGGAAIVAAHINNLGAEVDFFTVGSSNEKSKWLDDELKKIGVRKNMSSQFGASPTVKRRYRADNKSMLRVNKLSYVSPDMSLNNDIIDNLEKKIKDTDLLIFSDFSYGVINSNLASRVIELCKSNNVFVAADSQTSSQRGDITKFSNVDFIAPTELEARSAFNNNIDNLTVMTDQLYEKLNIKNIVITLGSDGVFIQNKFKEGTPLEPRTDQVPALCDTAIDVSGAGDVFLSVSSMCLALGASIWAASYLGSVASAVQVSRVGNSPLKVDEILENIVK